MGFIAKTVSAGVAAFSLALLAAAPAVGAVSRI